MNNYQYNSRGISDGKPTEILEASEVTTLVA